ncbi:MAG: hypothetical protein CVU39_07170 [Chloroflexi bacterium HGW-Chloroflexi-10]|nr:MAG: hypothetical protein CVU39_07170 [Chloroflexi bacterium HGW-Chloroflexi-10]
MVSRGNPRHENIPFCEFILFLKLKDLSGFFEHVSCDHVIIIYGGHRSEPAILAKTLNSDYLKF